MKKQLITLGIIGAMLGASPALANEPLSFKAKFLVKTVALYPFRVVRFVPHYGIDGFTIAWYSEVINMRMRGQGWEDFTFFSWGE